MRANRYFFLVIFPLFLVLAGIPVSAQLGFDLNIKKPKEYEDRVLRSEKTDKKFNVPRRFLQNTVTHYNYAFNAQNKLNEVLERAKTAFKDDYSVLLPFYNYSLDVTAMDSIQLDSITYKASSGIALHDVRNDWVDNLYLLWGAAYYLRKDFDSAYQMFQFINYAFAPKEKDGYYKAIGSARDGNSALSIATKEKKSLTRKLFSRPPSRNDAFIWQIRNYLAQDLYAEAASLIVTLRTDPLFPDRLQNDLHEVQAYWFYKQAVWDSAAVHLEQALSNAPTQQERARWEYLTGQLYEKAGLMKEARHNYDRSISRTTDLVMEIYARLAAIRTNTENGEEDISKNVAELVKMAGRDKYTDYQDIILYMAAQMELEGNHVDNALRLLLASTQVPANNPGQKNKAFLQLADLSFSRKEYKNAAVFYDSVDLDDKTVPDPEKISSRKQDLQIIVQSMAVIERQDSLQRIAALPEEERRDFVKKLVKQLRRQQGLKDEPVFTTGGSGGSQPTPPVSLFPGESKGEWYFYNAGSRTRGQTEFKAKWGSRPNADNWRRSAALLSNRMNNQGGDAGGNTGSGAEPASGNGVNFEDLYARLPLTGELLQQSNDSIARALFDLGKAYIQGIEDCNAGTATLENLRTRFPAFAPMDEVLFQLYYCYHKNGETTKAADIKRLMEEKHGSSNLTQILVTGKNPADPSANTDATKIYEKIYDLFIEGRFADAVALKANADSIYGDNFWTPQLLYIESVYYIRQRDDEKAKNILANIQNRFPKSPLADKAAGLIDVLGRRAQIEEELKNLVITRYTDSAGTQPVTVTPVTPPVIQKPDSAKVKPPVTVPAPAPAPDSLQKKTIPDTVRSKPAPTPYVYNATGKYMVVLVLNRVDPVFMNEAKNAFFRYNREVYYNKTYTAELTALDEENRLLLIAPFNDAQEAIAWVEKARPKTSTEIIPWLKGGKYYYTIITESNLSLLRFSQDLDEYKRFLEQHLPGKF